MYPRPDHCRRRAQHAVTLAVGRRVGLHGIGGYRGNPDTAAPPALVMGFGNVRERVIEPAIAAVADLLRWATIAIASRCSATVCASG
ncbi:MAG: hypothetical protein ACRDOL_34935 [Streptosporangiaceae bacterium]